MPGPKIGGEPSDPIQRQIDQLDREEAWMNLVKKLGRSVNKGSSQAELDALEEKFKRMARDEAEDFTQEEKSARIAKLAELIRDHGGPIGPSVARGLLEGFNEAREEDERRKRRE